MIFSVENGTILQTLTLQPPQTALTYTRVVYCMLKHTFNIHFLFINNFVFKQISIELICFLEVGLHFALN